MKSAAKVLTSVRRRRRLSVRAAAREMGVSHVALIGWESGSIPTGPFKRLIEVWSDGEIAPDSWPQTAAEKRATNLRRKLERSRAASS